MPMPLGRVPWRIYPMPNLMTNVKVALKISWDWLQEQMLLLPIQGRMAPEVVLQAVEDCILIFMHILSLLMNHSLYSIGKIVPITGTIGIFNGNKLELGENEWSLGFGLQFRSGRFLHRIFYGYNSNAMIDGNAMFGIILGIK